MKILLTKHVQFNKVPHASYYNIFFSVHSGKVHISGTLVDETHVEGNLSAEIKDAAILADTGPQLEALLVVVECRRQETQLMHCSSKVKTHLGEEKNDGRLLMSPQKGTKDACV